MEIIFGFMILIILGVLYFLPTIVANLTNKGNTAAIAMLNLLLGWTVVGWIVCLVWALTIDKEEK